MKLFRLFLVTFLLSGPALADCTAPAAPAGTLDYFAANKTFKFCDGADWIGVAQCGTSLGACTTAGTLDYDTGIANFKLCDGADWRPVANTKTLGACTTAGQMDYDTPEKTFKSCDGTNWKAWATVGGLAAHWKLNDGTGSTTAADSSGQGNTGTLTNMDPNTDWVAGKLGGALELDGVNDFVDVPDPANGMLDIGTGDFTISSWIKSNSTPGSVAGVVTKYNNASNPGYLLALNSPPNGGEIKFGIRDSDDGSFAQYDAVTNVLDDAWHLLAVTGDRDGNLTFYLDGEVDHTQALASHNADISTAYNVWIGREAGGSTRYFDGLIDDVRIYNRALSAAEIAALYNGGAGCQ